MWRLKTFVCLALVLMFAAGAAAKGPNITSQNPMRFGSATAKATADTIDLMGPNPAKPFIYSGNFQAPAVFPELSGGWTAVANNPPNHWHVDSYNNAAPMSNKVGWCGDIGLASCGGSDPAGGYGNKWHDILEFRKTTSGTAQTVRVQANLRYNTEPGFDFTTLQRRTEFYPNYEPIASGGQGLSWDGTGDAVVDYTFTYLQPELIGGTDIAVAFIVSSDGGWSDLDCLWPTAGAAIIDNIIVTGSNFAKATSIYVENFEDNVIGPDWAAVPNVGVGNFAHVWSNPGDVDDCASNYSRLVAFIDDGIVVPGTGGTIGYPGNDYGPGGFIVNNTGGLEGPTSHIECAAVSPVMVWPLPSTRYSGMTFAFNVYCHELLIPNDTPGIFYTWAVRSTDGGNIGDIDNAPWRDRGFVYYGGPNWLRSINHVDDLIVPGCTYVQVKLGIIELGYAFGFGDGTNGTPAPYFDNVSVKAYPTPGPFMASTEIYLANDGFPASGALNLTPGGLGSNVVRFDMAANMAPRAGGLNVPGDAIWIDVTPRPGGVLSLPIMHWKFAVKNPLFTDAMRTGLVPPNLMEGEVIGTLTYDAGVLVPNRYSFDLPDGPGLGEGGSMLFPGDVLHYYFSVQDDVWGDVRVSTMPKDVLGFGNPIPMAYDGAYTVNCLPSVSGPVGGPYTHPSLLFWNDFGFAGGGEDEWYGALRALKLVKGTNYDAFTTHGPSSGVGNGLGGRASAVQIAGYPAMLYTSGNLGAFTLSNGDATGDPSKDIPLLNNWLALGNRRLYMCGDDLASSLSGAGPVGQAFLATMGVQYSNDDDIRDNIEGQSAPLVKITTLNPVFTTVGEWIAYGGCENRVGDLDDGMNDFDNVTTFGSGQRLAQFTAIDQVTTPWASYAAAVLNEVGTNRIISANHDLIYVIDPRKAPAPLPARTLMLSDVLTYFGVPNDPGNVTEVLPPNQTFTVANYPNPFNPSLTIKYTLRNPGEVVMKVFNVRGALVKTLIDGPVTETEGSVVWNGTDDQGGSVSSGVYLVETRSHGEVNVLKAALLK